MVTVNKFEHLTSKYANLCQNKQDLDKVHGYIQIANSLLTHTNSDYCPSFELKCQKLECLVPYHKNFQIDPSVMQLMLNLDIQDTVTGVEKVDRQVKRYIDEDDLPLEDLEELYNGLTKDLSDSLGESDQKLGNSDNDYDQLLDNLNLLEAERIRKSIQK